MLWSMPGLGLAFLTVWLLRRLLRRTLEGRSLTGSLLIGLHPFLHFLFLLAAALAGGREALLWAAGGDCAGLLCSAAVLFARRTSAGDFRPSGDGGRRIKGSEERK